MLHKGRAIHDIPAVLCIGEVLFDYLAEQSGCGFAEVESWTPYPGGAPANVAVLSLV